ncbi:Rad9-domain-containing protein [Pseudovirgaria hyperparasitica]|uniref:DNA repair protein rad9 n=1 Tax=Pseudovirgaria hyperparasitica TaxID=470096 RepID=A0A6A6WEF1_9PEZI|nr:Rad9-domain-containing protein [Pseudovirgaria hyperparasitica]KAF2761093.1 Rad9-domain-containing protein [Pseudovirgaria hyperparasitica]
MVALKFTLAPDAAARVHDILTCLARFSETVSIEARPDGLSFTTLNSSKTTYASFTLDASQFFSRYKCAVAGGDSQVRFTCRILSKALLAVFKGRILDPRGRDSAIESCEVSVNDTADERECRFIIKMFCNQGVVKTYRLTYESADVMHALFDRNSAHNKWTIQSQMLKEYIDYFGARTEQLDIYAEDDRVIFTSFTEKITNGKEVLKQPLRTAVSAHKADFENFDAQDKIHTIISVRDFKSVVSHAETLKAAVSADYSQPNRPLQFSYGAEGIYCEYTLMTSGDRSAPPPITHAGPSVDRPSSRTRSTTTTDQQNKSRSERSAMPPPPVADSRSAARRTRPPGSAKPTPSVLPTEMTNANIPEDPDPESLFIPEQDDARWDPAEDEDDGETLGWDASANYEPGFQATFKDSGSHPTSEEQHSATEGLAPTQRLSQVRGLW